MTGAIPTVRRSGAYVYVIACREHVKIGIAKDVAKRLNQMQTGNPYPITLLKTWFCRNPEDAECKAHRYWKVFRVRGEWFEVPQEMLDDLLAKEELTFPHLHLYDLPERYTERGRQKLVATAIVTAKTDAERARAYRERRKLAAAW